MGRPRVSDERRVATAVRLPESLHRRLQVAAADRDVSANLLATRAIDAYLDRLPAVDDLLEPRGIVSTRTLSTQARSTRSGSTGSESKRSATP